MFSRFFGIQFPLFDDNDSATSTPELTVDDIENILLEDDNKEDDDKTEELEKTEEDKTPEKTEDTESKEIDIIDEDDEKPFELIVPVAKKKILAKYPNLFKDFPYLEKAYFDDQKYKEILPTIEDAQEALEKANALDAFEQELRAGSIEGLLSTLQNSDKAAFAKLVDNYLPHLAKVNQAAFNLIVANFTKQCIMAMIQEGKASNNEDLQKAALILNQFAFGSSTFTPPRGFSNNNGNQEQENKIQQERMEFVKERFNIVREDLNTKVQNSLKATINSHIDPKNSMTDYVKKNAVREAMETLDKVIAADSQFKAILDKLWDQAFKQNFSADSVGKIRSAYLAKSRTVLGAVILKTRNEALKGLSKKSNIEEPPKRGIINPGRPTSSTTNNPKEVPRGMKTLDFLMKD